MKKADADLTTEEAIEMIFGAGLAVTEADLNNPNNYVARTGSGRG